MAFNGSGTFVRLYNWVNDAANGIKILAARMDGEMDGMATGLSTCITKDGQTTITADIPFSNQKITELGDPSADADGANLKTVRNSTGSYATSTGTDIVALTLSPALSSYVAGQQITFLAGGTNTAAATLNVNGLGAKDIQKNGAALVADDITANDIVSVVYDGTQFQMISPARTPVLKDGAISGPKVNVDATFADRVGTNMTSTGADSLAGDFSDGVIDQAVIDKSTLPAFSATMSSSQAGATGDGTAATVQFDTEISDQGSDFNTSTYTFTAPETGIYAFTVALRMDSIVVANTTGQVRLVTSNRNYTYVFVTNGYSGNGLGKENTALCVDMDAGDTAYIELVVAGNASANVEIDAGGGEQSFFHGYKVA